MSRQFLHFGNAINPTQSSTVPWDTNFWNGGNQAIGYPFQSPAFQLISQQQGNLYDSSLRSIEPNKPTQDEPLQSQQAGI